METTAAKPDDEDVVWRAVNAAQSMAEERLNTILMAAIPQN